MLHSGTSGDHSRSEAYLRRSAALDHARRLERTPIVGVCGTVNSGKSTLVASFLSEAGKKRVLVGELDEEGTHRFVFWLPASWQTDGLGVMVERLIGETTGTKPERLADDPDEAAIQYNGRGDIAKQFEIPLVAYDTKLDEAGIAFLDCPDIQRPLDQMSKEFTAHKRLERLRTVAPLCSAFIVVASMQQKGSEDVGHLFESVCETASRAPLYFVLNMTKGDCLATYRKEAAATLIHWKVGDKVRRSYLSPLVPSMTPDAPCAPVVTSMDDDRAPLAELVTELDPAELQEQQKASCVDNLHRLLDEIADDIRRRDAEDSNRVSAAHETVADFLAGRMIDDTGGLRAIEFTEAAMRIAESVQRTAPMASGPPPRL